MGEEARSYAFSTAFAVWLTLVLLEILARPAVRKRWWLLYGILLIAGTYVFLFVALFAIVHALLLLVTRPGRRTLVPWAITVAAAAIACSPIALIAIGERHQIAYLATADRANFTAVFTTLWFSAWTVAVVGWALILFALGSEWRRRGGTVAARTDRGARIGAGQLPSLAVTGALWLTVPVISLLAVHTVTPDFTPRYLSFCAPAAALLIALGLARLSRVRRWLPLVASALLLATIVPVYVGQRTPYAKNNSDWAELSAVIGSHAQPGDGVIFDQSARPSQRPRLAMHTYPAGFTGLVDVALRTPFTANHTWYDAVMSVPQAERADRFDGIRHLWLIEHTDGVTVDSYGRTDLEQLGFEPVGALLITHSEQITEFSR
ncbi:hypothetical protein [Leifsonia poae]|uniref:hypothetical protein n=1 Tax=Leifsonia poae TaxID=110933 RepID=UPI003D67C44E